MFKTLFYGTFMRSISFSRNAKSVNGSPQVRAQCTLPFLSIRMVECSSAYSKSSYDLNRRAFAKPESDNNRNGSSPIFEDAAFFSGVALEIASTSVSSFAQSHLRFD